MWIIRVFKSIDYEVVVSLNSSVWEDSDITVVPTPTPPNIRSINFWCVIVKLDSITSSKVPTESELDKLLFVLIPSKRPFPSNVISYMSFTAFVIGNWHNWFVQGTISWDIDESIVKGIFIVVELLLDVSRFGWEMPSSSSFDFEVITFVVI